MSLNSRDCAATYLEMDIILYAGLWSLLYIIRVSEDIRVCQAYYNSYDSLLAANAYDCSEYYCVSWMSTIWATNAMRSLCSNTFMLSSVLEACFGLRGDRWRARAACRRRGELRKLLVITSRPSRAISSTPPRPADNRFSLNCICTYTCVFRHALK